MPILAAATSQLGLYAPMMLDVIVNSDGRHRDSDLGMAIPIVAIVFTFIWLIIKAIMAPLTERSKRPQTVASGGFSEEEIALLDKLQRTLSQMESRVEALETILIEATRNKEKYGSKL